MDLTQLEIAGGVAFLRMKNGVTNGISAAMVAEIQEHLEDVKREARGLVLGGGEKFFSMGLHLPSLLELDQPGLLDFYQTWNQLCLDLYTLPMPTAAAVRGHAPAGGTIMALTCDFRILADRKIKLGLNEAQIGVAVPYLADMILRQIAGDRVATSLIYTGQLFGPDQARLLALADELHPADDVDTKALEKISALAGLPHEAMAANKDARTRAVRREYERFGTEINRRAIDIWFEPRVRALLAEAARLF